MQRLDKISDWPLGSHGFRTLGRLRVLSRHLQQIKSRFSHAVMTGCETQHLQPSRPFVTWMQAPGLTFHMLVTQLVNFHEEAQTIEVEVSELPGKPESMTITTLNTTSAVDENSFQEPFLVRLVLHVWPCWAKLNNVPTLKSCWYC